MSDGLGNTLKDFKYTVIKPIKLYHKIKSLPEYSNISYKQFKSRNVSFDVFEAAFFNIDNDHIIDQLQLLNMFRYLAINLYGKSEQETIKTVMKMEKTKRTLMERLHNLDSEKDDIAIENINHILDQLSDLKTVLVDGLKASNKKIEQEIDFEVLLDSLLYPSSFDSTNLVSTLFYNLPTLGNLPNNGKKFNDKMRRVLASCSQNHNDEKKNYYISLVNLVHQANIYRIDKKILDICGLTVHDRKNPTRLSQKIANLEYDSNRGRYRIEDYILTIDNENTSKFDDAISIERLNNGSYILGIHIADVYSLGILPSSNESLEFKSSASLKENVDKNAISLFVEISSKGLIVDKKILMTSIKVRNNLLYDDIAKVLIDRRDDKLGHTVLELIGLYNIVNNTRLPVYPGPSSMAHALVQKYMLLYGCVVSDIASDNNIPILYQAGNDKSSRVSISEIHTNTGFDEINNLSTYARFTSPIWDIRSFINQTSICKCIFDRIEISEKNALRLALCSYKNKINKEISKKAANCKELHYLPVDPRNKRNGLQ